MKILPSHHISYVRGKKRCERSHGRGVNTAIHVFLLTDARVVVVHMIYTLVFNGFYNNNLVFTAITWFLQQLPGDSRHSHDACP